MGSLATKYRPNDFNEVIGQDHTIKILSKQLELNKYSNCYLLCGPTGTGKTTIARIFANMINKGCGSPIEIDAASNNGVDNIRDIIAHANERSLDSEYRVYIIDECHMITTAGWNAFLKCIEEPPKYTIFIFCTTDYQKIPATISNRMMRFNLNRVSTDLISSRLCEVLSMEGIQNVDHNVTDYIAKLSEGSVRSAIALLEKSLSLTQTLTIESVSEAVGNYKYTTLFNLINSIVDRNFVNIISIVEDTYFNGGDLKLLVDNLINLVLDIEKFCIFKNIDNTSLPSSLLPDVQYAANVFNVEDQNIKYYNDVLERLLQLKQNIKYDTNLKTTIEVELLNISK